MQPLTVVIKPTRDCNLRCKYCSVGDPAKSYMSEEILEASIEKIVKREEKSSTKYIWHGGEPLLPGLDFYRNIIQLQKPLRENGYSIINTIQTNGTLIDDEWAEFFKENNFGVGLSIDGPGEVNDRTRVFENDVGAYESIMKGSRILEKHGVKHGYLAVISKQNVGSIDQIIDFMKDIRKDYKLVAVSPIGRAAASTESLMTEADDFSKSQLRLFERWLDEGDRTQKNALWKYLVPVLTGEPIECMFLKDCQQSFIGIDSNGDVYPCGRFCGSGNLLYGNIARDSIEDILKNPAREKIMKRHENLPDKCKGCGFLGICNGGCPMQGFIRNGDINAEDYNCRQYKRVFGGILKGIKNELLVKQ